MADIIYQTLTVDITDNSTHPVVYVKQNDSARGLEITLTKDGEAVALSSDMIVTANIRKADGTASILYGAVTDDNTIQVQLTQNSLAVVGRAVCEVVVTLSDGTYYSSFIFVLRVIAVAVTPDDEVTSTNEYSALQDLLSQIAVLETEWTEAEASRAETFEELAYEIEHLKKGVDGVGISKIEKTDTTDLTDTYTITLTDETTYTFTVTNGAQGEQGEQGEKGEQGVGISSIELTSTSGLVDTYTITLEDGTTYTFTVTNGEAGTSISLTTEEDEDGKTYLVISPTTGITYTTEEEEGIVTLVLTI